MEINCFAIHENFMEKLGGKVKIYPEKLRSANGVIFIGCPPLMSAREDANDAHNISKSS